MRNIKGKADKAPREYIEYLLMKNVYHCTPQEFENMPNDLVELHLDFYNAEIKQRNDRIK